MKNKTPKIKTSIVLSIEAKMKGENLAHFKRQSMSELVEDLIINAKVVNGEDKN